MRCARAFGLREVILILASLAALSCGSSSTEPVIARAYVGPLSLPVRDSLGTKAKTLATLKHGDKVNIVGTRRRFFRVRVDGQDGWIDGFQLLTEREMEELKELAESTKDLPTQGAASAYDRLNVHTEADRNSPGFYQIPEKGEVQVIGHTIAQRVIGPQPDPPVMEMVRLAMEPPPSAQKKKKPSSKIPPPPRPAAPAVPKDWIDMSRIAATAPDATASAAEPNRRSVDQVRRALMEGAKKTSLTEDWTLLRMQDGRAGWVLTSMLLMAIPDDVAQYAEGSRITSYFPLMQVTTSEGAAKNFWLWTTRKREPDAYQFDSFRVFTWSLKRNRYETAYRENNIRGFYPVSVSKGPPVSFTLIVEEPGSGYARKTYEFDGRLVRLRSQVQQAAPNAATTKKAPMSSAFPKPAETKERGFLDKAGDAAKAHWRHLFH